MKTHLIRLAVRALMSDKYLALPVSIRRQMVYQFIFEGR